MELPRDLISLPKAGKRVGVSKTLVRRWITEGRLTGWRIAGGPLRVSEADVVALAVPEESQAKTTQPRLRRHSAFGARADRVYGPKVQRKEQ